MIPGAERTGDAVAVYGDSIAAAVNPGWTAPAAQAYLQGRFQNFAIVGGSLSADGAGMGIPALSSALYALVSAPSSFKRKTIVLFIGTNDYGGAGGGAGSAANFGSLYGQLLDAIHALNPAVEVFCITPLFRVNEPAANTFGNVMADYRTAMATAQSTRTWSVFVDSTSWVNAGDLADGLHPNGIGYAKILAQVRALLGF